MRTEQNDYDLAVARRIHNARHAKALKLVEVLIAHRADPSAVAALPIKGRKIVAQLAGCNMPSDDTWALVTELLRTQTVAA